MIGKSIQVFAPATVSNVGPGFDVMGFALYEPGDRVRLRITAREGVRLIRIWGDDGRLPRDVAKNTVSIAVRAMCRRLAPDFGVEIELSKGMPVGSGLGSSAASAAAGVFGLNRLLGDLYTRHELLEFALEGEAFASGAAHADNLAPCLFGGFVLVRGGAPPDVVSVDTPEDLVCAVVHPHVEIMTRESRRLLPKTVPLQNAVTQWGNAAALVAALFRGDPDLLSRTLRDVVAEPARGGLIPGYEAMKAAAIAAGALGAGISGSGPAVFALCRDMVGAGQAGRAMRRELDAIDVPGTLYLSRINRTGPRVIGDAS